MEVVRPQLYWIGKRCYRRNPLKDNQGFNPEDEELDDDDDDERGSFEALKNYSFWTAP